MSIKKAKEYRFTFKDAKGKLRVVHIQAHHLVDDGKDLIRLNLTGLLSRQVYELERWVRPETPLSEVHPRWVHFLALHRDKEAELETAQAARLLAEDTSEEHLAWLRARQRSVEGGERKRVEFETLDSAEPNDSN